MVRKFLGVGMAGVLFISSLGVGLVFVAAPIIVATAPSWAQTTVTSTAPSETTINVGQLLAPWLQILIAAVASFILALFGWLTKVINDKMGLSGNASVLTIEGQARDTLQSALTNAAGLVVMKAGSKLDQIKFDVHNPLIAQAITDVNKLAGDAVSRFGITAETIGALVIAKVGVLTASNPNVAPTTPESTAPQEVTSSPAAAAALKQ